MPSMWRRGGTLRLASVFPAAIETMVCFSVRCCRTSFRTGATNCGFTARNMMSAPLITCNISTQSKFAPASPGAHRC